MVAVALALGAACCWGLADFLGGLYSRRLPVPVVLLLVEGGGLVVVLGAALLLGEPFPDARHAGHALLAGALGVTALGCFYRALAMGTMSVVAPIGASGVALPVIVGLATGDRPSAMAAAGLVTVVVGVVLASREVHEDAQAARASRTSLWLALVAATGFGGFFVTFDVAADGGEVWTIVLIRAVAVPLVGSAWLLTARGTRPSRRDGLAITGVGIVDMIATAGLALASTRGDLSVVSVLGSMYPVVTIVLAAAVLHERLRPPQAAGVVLALTGVGLVAAG